MLKFQLIDKSIFVVAKMPFDFSAQHSNGQILPFRESLLAIFGILLVTMLVALDRTSFLPECRHCAG